jgi:ABC-type Fe3+ transport system substrate-binding protein
MVDNPETRDQLSRILQQLLGRPFQVVFQTGESAVLPNAAAVVIETKAGDEKDALVDYAVSDLGARVVREGK